ncbi:MAG: FAD/NAD(P)-binding protein, partial [Actinomycetes bacterium]
ARTGPLGLGLATDDGRLLGVEADLPVWTLGALRRGELWETTAIPEIRVQAADVARRALDRLSIRAARRSRPPRSTAGRPRDLLGLPLSTTAEAASAFDFGLDKVMQVQCGAEAEFRRAARLDPGFALAHAALAMLGHEAGAEVDVDRAVRDAQESVRRRGDDRERSLVDVVTRRVRDCQGEGARALKRHVRDHPRDAMAVSAAVPTIAFSGVTDIQQEAWELVESLAPAYGGDWWYAGLLAFVRQDQGRYDEAADLSGRALAVQPSSGHAVHARTHVHYETGDHAAGLAWLDPWIASNGREASHLAHFSWHAALHELSRGDEAAVRARYASQLAPPYVQGVRALVDSASLLWRCQVTGSWQGAGPLPVRAVLDAVDEDILSRPTTAFTAMHAALALTAAGDTAGLVRLRDHLAAQPGPVMSDVVVSLCDALAAFAEQRWCDAVRMLRLLGPWLVRLGGSAAQREIVEDTLLHALVAAGRCDEARALLDVRLDRRPSPLDVRRRRDAVTAR